MSKACVINEKECPFYNVAWGQTKGILAAESVASNPDLQIRITEYKPFWEHSLHVHPRQAEVIFVLSGSGVSETQEGRNPIFPGCAAYIPAGVEHATLNPNPEPLRVLIIKSPADLQK